MPTKYYLGNAIQKSEIQTITVSGSWSAGNYIEVKVNGKGPRLTLGASGLTTATVADKIYRTINSSSHDDNLVDDESRSCGAQQIPEMTAVEATYPGSGSVVTVVGRPGVDVKITVTASGGTTSLGETQAATGKWWWNNAENWSGGTVPANNDIVYFDNRAKASCLFGLPNADLSLQELHVTMGYAGFWLGLPAMNRLNPEKNTLQLESEWYPEYRQRLAKFSDESGDPATCTFTIGEGAGRGPRFVAIKQDEFASKLIVHKTGSTLPLETHVVHFDPDDSAAGSSACIYQGSVALSPDADTDDGHYTTIEIGQGARVYIGPSANFGADSPTITQSGGSLLCDTGTFVSATITILGGSCELLKGASSTTILKVFNPGVCFYSGQNPVNDVYVSGTLSFARATGAITWSSLPDKVHLFRGARILDPKRLVSWHATHGIDLVGCGLHEVRLMLGQNITITKLANDP